MRTLILAIFAVFFAGAAMAQDTAYLLSAVADVEAGRRTTPLIEQRDGGREATVTFLAKSIDGKAPRIVSDVTGWGERLDGTFDFNIGSMKRIGTSDWYFLQARVSLRARIEYTIAYGDTDHHVDPYNQRRPARADVVGDIHASEFVTEGYAPPEEFVDPPVSPSGVISESTIESGALARAYTVATYTPPGYSRDASYPLAVFHDRIPGQVPRVLDWLIARGVIKPLVAVFTRPKVDNGQYPTGARMRRFLCGELLKWVEARYAVTKVASGRAIIAVSFGGKDALDAAVSSVAYDRLGLLIPGRRIARADIAAVRNKRGNHRVRAAILAGLYDQANLPTALALRDALVATGHKIDYTEVPEGHSPVTWNYNLRKVLIGLFGTGTEENSGYDGVVTSIAPG